MSMGWRIIWRGIHPMKGEQVLDEEYPGNLNLRYNGGESADGQYNPCPGVVYSRIRYHADIYGGYYTAEVWG